MLAPAAAGAASRVAHAEGDGDREEYDEYDGEYEELHPVQGGAAHGGAAGG